MSSPLASSPRTYKALHASLGGLWLADGNTVRPLNRGEALRLSADEPLVILGAALTAARMGRSELAGLDLLELFAFVRPAQFCTPTPRGMALVLGLDVAAMHEATLLLKIADQLLIEAADPKHPNRPGAHTTMQALYRLKWPWAAQLIEIMPEPDKSERAIFVTLPEWEEAATRPKPAEVTLAPAAISQRLASLTHLGAEERLEQRAYAQATSHAFQPREMEAAPNVSLAEAGTGTGKTLGYLAPATLWARQATGTVWVSTFTKALQRQLDQELDRVYPTAELKARYSVVRKGRENYLCLLNLEEAINGGLNGRAAVLAHLAARWARWSRDGDMVGGDFPSWLMPLFGTGRLSALTDRRGECVYSACPHYRRCFIERASRKSAAAEIVIANHALVMANAVRGRSEGAGLNRIVFDEGHHLFDAADSAFSVQLTGGEMLEMRRWFLGPEKVSTGRSGGAGRRRGLEARLSEIVVQDDAVATALSNSLSAAKRLPAAEWLDRVISGNPDGALEVMLGAVRAHVFARSDDDDSGYGLEATLHHPLPALVDGAQAAMQSLDQLLKPLTALEARLIELQAEQPEWLDASLRPRLEGALSGIQLRRQTIAAWTSLLGQIGGTKNPDFVDWAKVERFQGNEISMGLSRHWLDPTLPFAKLVLEPAHGVVITSATLRDRVLSASDTLDWGQAEARTGANHLALPPKRFSTPSPFDYAEATRVMIVTDVKRGDVAQLAGAYKALIVAAGGGALGLFTAIARLKAVNARLAPLLAAEGLHLLAQHVDPIDTGTLVDMFRADRQASLIGTDALRDGVDVPGDSLRLVIMEGIPWPRPTILHAARRAAFGGSNYDDLVTRGKLAQAFGRLIRRNSDRGVFVLLGGAVPGRLTSAFPASVTIERLTLNDAAREVAGFLAASASPAMVPAI